MITPPTATYQELSYFDSQDLSPYQSLVPISKLEISRRYLTVENSIGEGSFGKVCLASVSGTHLRIQEGKRVAVKKLKGESKNMRFPKSNDFIH